MEVTIATDMKEPVPQQKTILSEERQDPLPEIAKASCEIEQIGDTIVKVEFVEFIGKRKKKTTHIEVRQSELDQMVENADGRVAIQFSLF